MFSCNNSSINSNLESTNSNQLIGTWKLVYAEIREQDSVTIKDTSTSEFIKIINKSHFAFFNQNLENSDDFYGGAGTYILDGNSYVETLNFIENNSFRGHTFSFNIEFKGDTLIQSGLEKIKDANINRYIVEKYIKIKNKR